MTAKNTAENRVLNGMRWCSHGQHYTRDLDGGFNKTLPRQWTRWTCKNCMAKGDEAKKKAALQK